MNNPTSFLPRRTFAAQELIAVLVQHPRAAKWSCRRKTSGDLKTDYVYKRSTSLVVDIACELLGLPQSLELSPGRQIVAVLVCVDIDTGPLLGILLKEEVARAETLRFSASFWTILPNPARREASSS